MHMMKDGRHFITVCDHTIKYWEKESGKHVFTVYLGKPNPEIVVVNDDLFIITANYLDIISIDIAQGVARTLFTVDQSIQGIEFLLSSTDSNTIFLLTRRHGETEDRIYYLERWDSRTGKITHSLRINYEFAKIALSPDNKMLLVQEEFRVSKWNSADLTFFGVLYQCDLEKKERLGGTIAFFPNSPQILIFPTDRMLILNYEGEIQESVPFKVGFWSLKFSEDERFLGIAVMDNYILVLDLLKRMPVLQKTYSNFIWDICFTPDGSQIGAAGAYPPVFFDLDKNNKAHYHGGVVGSMDKVHPSPNGSFVLTATRVYEKEFLRSTILEKFSVYEAKPEVLFLSDEDAYVYDLTNTHALIQPSKSNLVVIAIESGKVISDIKVKNEGVEIKFKRGLLLPDSTQVLLQKENDECLVYDWNTQQTSDRLCLFYWYDDPVIDPTGKYVLTCSEWDIGIFTVEEGKFVFGVEKSAVPGALGLGDFRQACFSNEPHLLGIFCDNGYVICLDWRVRKVSHQFKMAPNDIGETIAFSPCNHFLLVNCTNSMTYVWSLAQNGLVWKQNSNNYSSTEPFLFNEVLGVWKWDNIAFFTSEKPDGSAIIRPVSGLEVLEKGIIEGECNFWEE